MRSVDVHEEVDMDTCAERLREEAGTRWATHDFVELRKISPNANLGSIRESLLISPQEKYEASSGNDLSLTGGCTEENNREGKNFKYKTGEEKYAIEELTNASNYNDEMKRVWGTGEENEKQENAICEGAFDRGQILEATGGSTDALEADDCGDAGNGMEREVTESDGHVTTGFPKHLRNPHISYVRVNEGHDTALLIQGIQQSSALISSPLSIAPLASSTVPFSSSPSLAADTWLRHVGLSASQKLIEEGAEDSLHGGYRHGENFLRDTNAEDRPIDGIFTGGLVKEAHLNRVGSSLQESRQVQSSHFERLQPSPYKDYTDLMEPAGGNAYTPHHSGMEDSAQENKTVINDYPLRRVLSDSFTGLLMDDAMVAQCGHSFGISSLQRVMETSLCLSCGAPVPPGSLIPNYALRAAVQAYKREEQFWPNSSKGPKRRREHLEQPESSDGKKASRAPAGSTENTATDISRPKGVQFPFVVNDRVLIKGNKRTPERFVGREAIITTQCLNGWYLVRTLDNGESVRLQYRSLQKLGDNEMPTGVDTGIYLRQSGDTVGGAEPSKGQSSTSVPTSLSDDAKEDGSPSNPNDTMVATSFPSSVSKGLRSDFVNRANRGVRRGSSMRAADVTGASWLSGGTSSNSSQELQAEQIEEKLLAPYFFEVQGKSAQEAGIMDDSKHEGLEMTENVAGLEKVSIGMEGSSPEGFGWQYAQGMKGSKVWHGTESCTTEGKVWRKERTINAGGDLIDEGTFATSNEGENFSIRSKRSVLHPRNTHLTGAMDLPESDPYKKVYVSGSRRRGGVGDEHTSISMKQSASASLDNKPGVKSISFFKDQPLDNNEGKTSGESDCIKNVVYLYETIRDGMLHLESEIPWSCMQKSWKRCRPDWLRTLQESNTAKDLGTKLQELRDALLLTEAGGMSDDEWNKRLTAALESGEMDVIAFLWGRIHEDVTKWMESKPKRNRQPLSIKSETIDLADLQKLFPQLCVGGLSRAGISAATTVAAAEAFADGQLDTEALLAVPMRLIREHNIQDLHAVREAIEREKRHITAKLMQIDSSVVGKEDFKNEAVEIDILIENPKHLPASPALLTVEAPLTTVFANDANILTSDRGSNFVDAPLIKNGEQLMVLPVEDTDGEATDMSDSD